MLKEVGFSAFKEGSMETTTKHITEKMQTSEDVIYEIKGKTFIVESVFQGEGNETLGSILMRLMEADITK